ARRRDAHQEEGTEEHEVGRLAAGAVDGGDLDTEVVDDALLSGSALLTLNREISRRHSTSPYDEVLTRHDNRGSTLADRLWQDNQLSITRRPQELVVARDSRPPFATIFPRPPP